MVFMLLLSIEKLEDNLSLAFDCNVIFQLLSKLDFVLEQLCIHDIMQQDTGSPTSYTS